MSPIWSTIESVPGLAAVPAEWQRLSGCEYDALRSAFLQSAARRASSYPCPHDCGCAHRVVVHRSGAIVGVCDCDRHRCDNIPLTDAEINVLQLNRAKLGRAVANAFGCEARQADLGIINTMQVGAFGAGGLPVVLTIQHDPDELRHAVAELSARVPTGFVLLSPTTRFIDARAKALLASSKAGFFDLASHLTVMSDGRLVARKAGGELFSPFLPGSEPADEDVLRRVFALVRQLDTDERSKNPTVLQVFSLYCGKLMTAEQVAHKCGCAKGTVINRLKTLERKVGIAPDKLRAYSPVFNNVEDELSDSRAKSVYRKGAIDDGGEAE